MKSVIYAINGLRAWVDVADQLEEEEGWTPQYWISTPELQGQVTSRFDGTTFHVHYDAHRGIPPGKYQNTELHSLDASDLNRYEGHVNTALRLMNRMEVDESFHFDMRIHHFYRLLSYWITVVDDIGPDIVIFDSSPHVMAHYILYIICKERDVRTIILTPTSIPGTIFARSKLDSMPDRIRANLEELRGGRPTISKINNKYVNKIRRQDYEDAKPAFMENKQKTQSRLSNLKQILNYPRNLYDSFTNEPQTYLVPPGGSVEDELSLVQRFIHGRNERRKKEHLKKHYHRLCRTPVFDRDYVYVPLHYQPERTSVPEGGVFGDQFLFIRLLSNTVSKGWEIYVKEHPSQFTLGNKGQHGRFSRLYDYINGIDGVTLIPSSTNSFDLIDNAKAVATLTGTAGWESVIRGTPSIVFGNAWYRDCPGVYHVKTRNQVASTLDEIHSGETPSEESIETFVATIESIAQTGYLSPFSMDADSIAYDDNVEGLVNAIRTEYYA